MNRSTLTRFSEVIGIALFSYNDQNLDKFEAEKKRTSLLYSQEVLYYLTIIHKLLVNI